MQTDKKFQGEAARKWRRGVAGKSGSMFTLKFPLEMPPDGLDFTAAAKLGNIVSGTEKGTLAGFLLAVHLSGFRLYPKDVWHTGAAQPMPSRGFIKSLRDNYPDFAVPPELSPQGIKEWAVSDFRKTKFSREELSEKFIKHFKLGGGAKGPHEAATVLAQTAAKTIADNFSGFADLTEDGKGGRKVLEILRKNLKLRGVEFPEDAAERPPPDLPGDMSATIAFCARPMPPAADSECALHQAVALALRDCRKENGGEHGGFSAADVQTRITSGKNSAGLSWLFGRGLLAFRKYPPEKLAAWLPAENGAKRNVRQIARLCEYAKALPADVPLFGKLKHYADFRQQIGGKLDSWAANYLTRLGELRESFGESPGVSPDKFLPEALNSSAVQEEILDGLNLTPEIVRQEVRAAADVFAEGKNLIGKFTGETDELPSAEDMDKLDSVAASMEQTAGMINQIANLAKQRAEDAGEPAPLLDGGADLAAAWKALAEISMPKWLAKPRKLNRISGGVPDAREEMRKKAEQFSELLGEWQKYFLQLEAECPPPPKDKNSVLQFLHRLARLARRMRDGNKREIAGLLAPHFADYQNGKSKNCGKFLFNNTGFLWKHEKSNSRHEPYKLGDSAYAADWHISLGALTDGWRETMGENCREKLGDWLALQNLLLSRRLESLRGKTVKKGAARPGEKIADMIPAHWRRYLDGAAVPGDVCLRVFNLYHGELRGMLFSLLRKSFILRAAFQPVLGDQKPSFLQTPKDKPWAVSERTKNSAKPIRAALEALKSAGLFSGGEINTPAAHQFILTQKELSAAAKKAYFSQAPHEWYLALPWMGGVIPQKSGAAADKNGKLLPGVKKCAALRLLGPPSYKNRITKTLLGQWKAAEHAVVAEQKYMTELRWADGKLSADAHPEKTPSVFGAVPFSPADAPKEKPLFDKLVAVDLGERGIGWAVFDVRKFLEDFGGAGGGIDQTKINPLCAGNIAIPAVRGLIHAARRHRKSAQPRQRMQQSYSSVLAETRAAVTGKVCNEIEKLCAKYNAFPVLESNVAGFESGGNQLKSVYGSVVRRYCFSRVEAHQNARKHHWFGADRWEHPYLLERAKYDDAKKEYVDGAAKPFNLYPGAAVNAARTSQICAVCGRNPMAHVLPKNNAVEKGGYAELPDGKIRLFAVSVVRAEDLDAARAVKEHRRRKIRMPWWRNPAAAKNYDEKSMRQLLKGNMRRPPRSTRSKDTTQSRYFCVYVGCKNHWDADKLRRLEAAKGNARQREWGAHADENAAVNIGRRFLAGEAGKTPKLHREKSFRKMREFAQKRYNGK